MFHFMSLCAVRDDFHLEKSFPSNSTMASEGAVAGAALVDEMDGLTILGTGFHNSEDCGVCFEVSSWAFRIIAEHNMIEIATTFLNITLSFLF
jgi:hypothetical protein